MQIQNMTFRVRAGLGLAVGLLAGGAVAWLLAGVLLEFFATGRLAGLDWAAVAQDFLAAPERRRKQVGILAGGAGAAVLSLALYGALRGPTSAYGDARFAAPGDLRRELYAARLAAPDATDHELILAKIGPPEARGADYVKSEEKPHALVIAPTESGKTSGFVIPNLLHFNGSIVALDVKGELFEETARRRLEMGDRVFNFRPDKPTESCGYNPLAAADRLEDPDERWVETSDVVNYLAAPQNAQMEGFIDSGKAIFTAVAMVMLARGRPWLGDVLTAINTATRDDYAAMADEATYPRARAELVAAAGQEPKILQSYVSVLLNAGLGIFRDPMVDRVTRRNDLDFPDLRRNPAAIYFHVPTRRTAFYAPLIRLFFNHLIGGLQTNLPAKTGEEFKVLILLDEFDQLGRMPMVAEAFKTIRGYQGRMAVITQSLAGLQKIYGREEVRNLMTNAGNKIIMATDDPETTRYVSDTIGDRTRLQTSRSFDAVSILKGGATVREEGARLIRSEHVSRMDPDKLIILRTQMMPIMADKIKWWRDPWFREVHAGQGGPYPEPDAAAIRAADEAAAEAQAESAAGSGEAEGFPLTEPTGPVVERPAEEDISAEDGAALDVFASNLAALEQHADLRGEGAGSQRSMER